MYDVHVVLGCVAKNLYIGSTVLQTPLSHLELIRTPSLIIPFSQQKFLSIRIALANLNIHQYDL